MHRHRVKYLAETVQQQQRVIAYVDGFNLYFGLREAKLRSSRWLDIPGVCKSLLRLHQELQFVRYFTARVSHDKGASERQSLYIDALQSRGGVKIDFGQFLRRPVRCPECGVTRFKPEEKKTDVNIAVRMLEDAFEDRFDVAMLISGDSDLVPPVEYIKHRFKNKRVIVAEPPKRQSLQLSECAHASFRIWSSKIRANRLPNPVITTDGVKLWAPEGWLPKGVSDS